MTEWSPKTLDDIEETIANLKGQGMTFEEWLAEQENCHPTDWNDAKSVYRFWTDVARRAWEAGYDEGVADTDPAVH